MSKYYSVQMTAIYGTPAHHLPNCRAILEFSEPQGNEQAVKDKAGYITEIAFTDALKRKDVKKLSHEANPIENPLLTKEPDRVIDDVKVWLFLE